jgi:low affinity Fe/Cu permease
MVADAVAHPAVQLGVLTSTMSIGSFLLTQMVLNQQRRRELALQIKIDELILAKSGARDELAGIERKTEDEIEQLRAGRDIDD